MKSVTVNLDYFKQTGKYYSSGSFKCLMSRNLHDIWEDVETMQREGKLPSLVDGGGKDFIILVNVPNHPHDHPRLILPLKL